MGPKRGYTQSKEHKDKRAKAVRLAYTEGRHTGGFQKGNKLSRFTGLKHTAEAKAKMSEYRKTHNPMFNEESRKKMSETRKRLGSNKGSKNSNWKGGISSINSKLRNTSEYRAWRLEVFKRDKYECQECGAKSRKGKYTYITAHHIKSFSQYKELRYDVDNGKTLCIKCHAKKTSHEMLGNHKGVRLCQ